jgi:hypothetical protein
MQRTQKEISPVIGDLSILVKTYSTCAFSRETNSLYVEVSKRRDSHVIEITQMLHLVVDPIDAAVMNT